MTNIGKIIQDGYCGGYFGSNYALIGSIIFAEGSAWVVILRQDNLYAFANFQIRNNNGTYRIQEDMQEVIDDWCTKKEEDV